MANVHPKNFSELSLSQQLLKILNEMGFSEMTPIQAASLPLSLAGKDLIGQSQTGSGKTAAFLLPILQKIKLNESHVQALILCPTRELSDQVLRESRKFSKASPGLQCVSLVGGQPYPPQTQALQRGVQLVVGTPGRTLEHLNERNGDFSKLEFLVLDEADRMLEEGFADELNAIIDQLPKKRQTLFFSATFPEGVEILSRKYQQNAERVTIVQDVENFLQIEQFVYASENPQKVETLLKILQQHPSPCTLVFCRTKATVAEVGQTLKKLKVNCDVLHGDLEQSERDHVTARFRNGSVRVLVATDVAARGLDVDVLDLVINMDLPSSPEIYIHRIGRTGRAGRKGKAVSIATEYEIPKIAEIEETTGVVMTRKSLQNVESTVLGPEFQTAFKRTIQISGGRGDKLRPGDILGALTAEPQALVSKDIGKIDIFDRFSYVAIETAQVDKALSKLQSTKIKGRKFKVYLV